MITVDTTGLGKAIAVLRRVPTMQRAVGEVYLAGKRNQDLGVWHSNGTATMPKRNVFFLPRATVRAVGLVMKRGVEDVLKGRSSGMKQAMSDAARVAADAYRQNIDTGKTDTGKIAPLSPAYKKAKDATWGKREILVASGALYDSIKHRVVNE